MRCARARVVKGKLAWLTARAACRLSAERGAVQCQERVQSAVQARLHHFCRAPLCGTPGAPPRAARAYRMCAPSHDRVARAAVDPGTCRALAMCKLCAAHAPWQCRWWRRPHVSILATRPPGVASDCVKRAVPVKRLLCVQVYLWQGLHSGALRELYLDASQRELKLRLVCSLNRHARKLEAQGLASLGARRESHSRRACTLCHRLAVLAPPTGCRCYAGLCR